MKAMLDNFNKKIICLHQGVVSKKIVSQIPKEHLLESKLVESGELSLNQVAHTNRIFASEAFRSAISKHGSHDFDDCVGLAINESSDSHFDRCVITSWKIGGNETFDISRRSSKCSQETFHNTVFDCLNDLFSTQRKTEYKVIEDINYKQKLMNEFLAPEDMRVDFYCSDFERKISDILAHKIDFVCITKDGLVLEENVSDVVLSGSFNPLHKGHVSLLEHAAETVANLSLSSRKCFEMPIVNADKGSLQLCEVLKRVTQFVGIHSLLISNAPIFSKKAFLFPKCYFVVGYHTASRIVMDKVILENLISFRE